MNDIHDNQQKYFAGGRSILKHALLGNHKLEKVASKSNKVLYISGRYTDHWLLIKEL